jgi:hypothetical protein
LKPPHAVSAFEEATLPKGTRYLTIAVLLAVLDTAVALRCGGAIWTAWSGIVRTHPPNVPLGRIVGVLAVQKDVLPKSAAGKAANYALALWSKTHAIPRMRGVGIFK